MPHTPGPWVPFEKYIKQLAGPVVCVMEEYTGAIHETFDNWEANARLIAAAPEMYEALKRLVSSGEVVCTKVSAHDCAFDAARAVLAKIAK